ncbi:hypothetical protein CW304_19055 [Bacillus sp. UFRGS-B20]|nr:hypothetical protein CW304_19055 [Bacillus sp. UFRGS-B20]
MFSYQINIVICLVCCSIVDLIVKNCCEIMFFYVLSRLLHFTYRPHLNGLCIHSRKNDFLFLISCITKSIRPTFSVPIQLEEAIS